MSDRIVGGLAVLAVALAAFIGAPAGTADRAFLGWAAARFELGPAAQACVARQLDRGLLDGMPADDPTPAQLRQHGIEVLPLDRRQVAGDAVLACALAYGDRR